MLKSVQLNQQWPSDSPFSEGTQKTSVLFKKQSYSGPLDYSDTTCQKGKKEEEQQDNLCLDSRTLLS